MGKVKKQKRHLRFDYNKNRKNIRKKEKRLPDIKCPEIKQAWDKTKSMKQNLKDMGLSSDPNVTIKFPRQKTSRRGMIEDIMEVEIEKTPEKQFVADDLEKQSKIPYKKKMTMSDEEAGLCVYMMDKYGEDFKAMSRDRRNHYQETPKQIKRKIERFKSIPDMYQIYTEARQGITLPVKENVSDSSDLHHDEMSPSGLKSFLGMAPNRCSTRLYDACLRNGHFVSPELSHSSKITVFAPSSALCRVRRRLQFGRKAPKDRSITTEEVD